MWFQMWFQTYKHPESTQVITSHEYPYLVEITKNLAYSVFIPKIKSGTTNGTTFIHKETNVVPNVVPKYFKEIFLLLLNNTINVKNMHPHRLGLNL